MAEAIATALRADPGSVLAFLPGAAEIRRTESQLRRARAGPGGRDRAAVRRARRRRAGPRDCAGAEGPAQGGAGDLDRRDLADHRGRADRGRLRPGAGAALRAGYRADAAGNGARLARRGRSAPRPRRPHRARRLLPAVGRAADRVAARPTPSRKSSAPICRRWCSIWRNGASPIRRKLAFLDPPPAPALEGGARACCANSARSTPMAASPTRARACARWRCRRGWRG